jgi:hypothetical protein
LKAASRRALVAWTVASRARSSPFFARAQSIRDVLYAAKLFLYVALAAAAVIVIPGAFVMWWLSGWSLP